MTLEEIRTRTAIASKDLINNMSDEVRDILKESSESNEFSIEDYYSNSIGQSIVNDFESGNFIEVKCGQ